jgi:hypothetical protein
MLEAPHGPKTGEQILTDLCRWMDANGPLATLRHGFKCYGRTLHVAYFKAAHELNPELDGAGARRGRRGAWHRTSGRTMSPTDGPKKPSSLPIVAATPGPRWSAWAGRR